MGWRTLADKVNYWLRLRAARKEREAARKDDPDPAIPHGEGMPLSVKWEKVAAWEREAYKVSSLHPLNGGKVLLGCYNNRERGTARLQVVDAAGTRKEIWKGGEETIGQGWKGGGQWWLPVERKNGNIIGVPLDGASASAATAQGGQYSCKIMDCHVAVGNRLFQVGDPENPRASFPRLGTIISGLLCADGEWIASDDEHGIMSERGWFIECLCPELAFVGGKAMAFLRSGEVRVIEGEKLGQAIGNTRRKCRRAWSDGRLCWWTTAPSDGDGTHGVWCTDGNTMIKVGEFPGLAESTTAGALGSLFGSAICVGSDGALWCATTDETQNGWVLYRGIPEWPEPVTPAPEPDAVPEPPETDAADFTPPARTGSPSWTGNGAWNSFRVDGRSTESSNQRVTVEAWFRAKSWSGGGKEQAAGFCVASKGLVGSHWGLCFMVRPGGLVWNATKGEVVAACTVTLGAWHHVKAVAERERVRMWLDGRELAVGEKPFAGALIQDSSEPLRIGGYYTDYPSATWFNQSLAGEISDWKVEMA